MERFLAKWAPRPSRCTRKVKRWVRNVVGMFEKGVKP